VSATQEQFFAKKKIGKKKNKKPKTKQTKKAINLFFSLPNTWLIINYYFDEIGYNCTE
jgi:TnpA family transposase